MPDNNEKGGDLSEYIQRQLSQKKTREEITEKLKQMGWEEKEINNCFLIIDEAKKKRRKKIIMNVSATLFIIIAIAFIFLFAPRSPVKYEKVETISPSGSVQVSEENIDSVIYDNETGEEIIIPSRIAEQRARQQREIEEERLAEEIELNRSVPTPP